MDHEDPTSQQMDRLTIAAHNTITHWSDTQVRGYLKEHPSYVLHGLALIEDIVRTVRAAAETEKTSWGELAGDPHQDFEDQVTDYRNHTCNCPNCWQGRSDAIDYSLPIVTVARRNPTPEDYAKAASTPVPPRGNAPTPTWFTFLTGGWFCDYPHLDPSVLCGATNINDATGQGLAHLDDHHPGWKLPCARCSKPQWNADESTRCHDCRWRTR